MAGNSEASGLGTREAVGQNAQGSAPRERGGPGSLVQEPGSELGMGKKRSSKSLLVFLAKAQECF